MSIKCVECREGPCRDKQIGGPCDVVTFTPEKIRTRFDIEEDLRQLWDTRRSVEIDMDKYRVETYTFDDDWPDEAWLDEPDPPPPDLPTAELGNPRSVLTPHGAVEVGGEQKQRPAPTGCTGAR